MLLVNEMLLIYTMQYKNKKPSCR